MPEIISSIPYAGSYVELKTTQQLNTTADDVLYISIPNFPNYALINRIQITAVEDGVIGQVIVRVLSDAAAYRAAATDREKQGYVFVAYNNQVGNGPPAATWELDDSLTSAVYYRDDTSSNSIHLSLTCVVLNKATAFNVRIWADQVPIDKGYAGRQQSFREAYLLYDHSIDDFVDYSTALRNPWHHSLNPKTILHDIDANDEYLYIGAMKPFYRVYCSIATPLDNPTDINLVVEYLDFQGTWQSVNLFDNTDASLITGGGTVNLPFSYSGSIYWTIPGQWDKRVLPDVGSVEPPDGDTPRYWVRFSLDDSPATWPTFYAIRQYAATGI